MSPTTRFPMLRALAAAGLMGTASFIRPAITEAQITGADQALRNQIALLVRPSWGPTWSPTPTDPAAIEGEQALLGRTSSGKSRAERASPASRDGVPAVTDGAAALLARRNSFQAEEQ